MKNKWEEQLIDPSVCYSCNVMPVSLADPIKVSRLVRLVKVPLIIPVDEIKNAWYFSKIHFASMLYFVAKCYNYCDQGLNKEESQHELKNMQKQLL